MRQTMQNKRAVLSFALVAVMALILTLGFKGVFDSANAQTKEPTSAKAMVEGNPAQQITLLPPPKDINELSMEVAALRTLYLLKAGPDQAPDHNAFPGFKDNSKNCAQAPRERRPAQVSNNYRKLLIDLRAAFIMNNEERIGELSSQLESLTDDEQPDLDDVIEITEQSKKSGATVLRNYFDPNRIAGYIAAYGKDFPEPYILMKRTVRGDLKGSWPTPDVWKETLEFVIKEVSSSIAGFNPRTREDVAAKVAKLLDRAYGMSDEQLKKEWSRGGAGIRGQVASIANMAGPTDVIKNVLERDFAELLSNPRLLNAMEAREDYLKKKSSTAANP